MRTTIAGLVVSAVVVCGLTAACDVRDDAPATTGTSTKTVGGGSAGDAVPADELRFPGTTVTAALTGFDRRLQMVDFELIELAPGTGTMEPHYVDVPGDGPHRLPFADNLKVWSANIICSSESETGVTVDERGRGDQPCTKQQLLDAIDHGSGSLTVEFKVDSKDRIYEVAKLYHP
jgi:hypothetical protein